MGPGTPSEGIPKEINPTKGEGSQSVVKKVDEPAKQTPPLAQKEIPEQSLPIDDQQPTSPEQPSQPEIRYDADGIPIGVLRELPSKIDSNGETVPSTAFAERVIMLIDGQEHAFDVLVPKESPYDMSSEQWEQWIGENIPEFGQLEERLEKDQTYQSMSDEQKSVIHDLILKTNFQERAGQNMTFLADGISDMWDDLEKTNPNLPAAQIVFAPMDFDKASYAGVFNIAGSNIVVVNTPMFEAFCLADVDTIPAFFSHDGQRLHATTPDNLMYLFGREEMNHIDCIMQYGVPAELNLQGATLAQYDAQLHELRSLRDQRRYVMTHPEEFPSPGGDIPTELQVLNARIHAAIAERRKQKQAEFNSDIEYDENGVPVVTWQNLPSRIGPDGETIPATAQTANLIFENEAVDVTSPIESPYQFSQENWIDWITDNFPDFGNPERLYQSDLFQDLSQKQQDALQDREVLSQIIKERLGLYITGLMKGVISGYEDLNITNLELTLPKISFTSLNYQDLGYSLAAAVPEYNIISINTAALENYCLMEPDLLYYFISRVDRVPYGVLTPKSRTLLAGREEINHIDDYIQHGNSSSAPLNPDEVTQAEYDAQPHEFRALRDNWRYVKAHPEEFPNPENGWPEELEILTERIRAAKTERRRQRNQAIVEPPTETINIGESIEQEKT